MSGLAPRTGTSSTTWGWASSQWSETLVADQPMVTGQTVRAEQDRVAPAALGVAGHDYRSSRGRLRLEERRDHVLAQGGLVAQDDQRGLQPPAPSGRMPTWSEEDRPRSGCGLRTRVSPSPGDGLLHRCRVVADTTTVWQKCEPGERVEDVLQDRPPLERRPAACRPRSGSRPRPRGRRPRRAPGRSCARRGRSGGRRLGPGRCGGRPPPGQQRPTARAVPLGDDLRHDRQGRLGRLPPAQVEPDRAVQACQLRLPSRRPPAAAPGGRPASCGCPPPRRSGSPRGSAVTIAGSSNLTSWRQHRDGVGRAEADPLRDLVRPAHAQPVGVGEPLAVGERRAARPRRPSRTPACARERDERDGDLDRTDDDQARPARRTPRRTTARRRRARRCATCPARGVRRAAAASCLIGGRRRRSCHQAGPPRPARAPALGGRAAAPGGGAELGRWRVGGSGVRTARPAHGPRRPRPAPRRTRGLHQHIDRAAAGQAHVPRLLVADAVADDARAPGRGGPPRSPRTPRPPRSRRSRSRPAARRRRPSSTAPSGRGAEPNVRTTTARPRLDVLGLPRPQRLEQLPHGDGPDPAPRAAGAGRGAQPGRGPPAAARPASAARQAARGWPGRWPAGSRRCTG